MESYFETVIVSSESTKEIKEKRLDSILSDFAIKNRDIFNIMSSYNKSITKMNKDM